LIDNPLIIRYFGRNVCRMYPKCTDMKPLPEAAWAIQARNRTQRKKEPTIA
jgi:hypothetical protein